MHFRAGFSLLELLITLVIVTLFTLWAVPNFGPIIQSNRLTNQVNQLAHGLHSARTTAIAQQVNTVMCATEDQATCSDDWNRSIIIFIDINNNQLKDAGERQLLNIEQITNDTIRRTGPASAIRFAMTGLTATPATLTLCSTKSELTETITVSLQGRVRTSNAARKCSSTSSSST